METQLPQWKSELERLVEEALKQHAAQTPNKKYL